MTFAQTTTRTFTLFNPPDVDAEHELWGANCGPTALAALLGKSVASMRRTIETVQGGEFKGFMHAGHLRDALRSEGHDPRRCDYEQSNWLWPRGQGLAVIQFVGPWCFPPAPKAARFRHTHTVATAANGAFIYDGNARRWLARADWERLILAELLKDTKRATGWYVTTVLEVEP